VAKRVVVFGFDPARLRDSWIVQDYLPSAADLEQTRMSIDEAAGLIGATRVEPVPIPHDCVDGFLHAYWRRPHAYLDAEVRAGISVFSLLDEAAVRQGLARLAADLESGAWHRRHGHLLDLDELDLGYRLVVADG
jgi:hypothetical protein